MAAEPPDLRELKIRAALLLKALRAGAPAARARLAKAGVRPRGEPQLKHALEAVAREAGAEGWAELKRAREAAPARFDTESFFAAGGGAFFNRWFATYAEARASLEAMGGFLFPYRRQFFVCEAGFLEARGVDAADPDWARIGFDWVAPADPAARDRLERRLLAR